MDHGRPNLKMRVVLRALLLVLTTGPLVLVGMPPRHAQGMPSIGWKTISFGTANDVGATTDTVTSVAAGDLDNDGDLDIVTASGPGEDYEIIAWENDGSAFAGTWSPNDVGASTASVLAVALGDLDNDGDLDIVSGSADGENYEVIAWQNDGSPFAGTWSPNDVGASTDHVYSVAVGDLDNDGDLDIVSGSALGEDNEVIAWENDGDPFTDLWSQNDVGATSAETVVALGDLDDDGDLDIVSGSGSGAEYVVIAWENDGSPFTDLWSSQNDVGASADTVRSVALGDLDDDGDLDIVSGGHSGEDYEVIAWENDGSPFTDLWSQTDVGASTANVCSVALGDLDNDGDLDIASGSLSAADYEVIAWENTLVHRNLLFAPGGNDVGASTASVSSSAVGDLDNDGDLDVVSGSFSAEDYEVIAWENDGSPFTGLWSQNDVGASTDDVYSVAVGDLDNDGDLDVVSGSAPGEDYEVIAWENDGSPFTGLWSQNDVGTSADFVLTVTVGDLDNDGDLDIVSATGSGDDYEIIAWENDGSPFTGLWSQDDVGTSTDSVMSVALGDLDHDGDLDIVSGAYSGADYEVIAWRNLGSDWWGYVPLTLKNYTP